MVARIKGRERNSFFQGDLMVQIFEKIEGWNSKIHPKVKSILTLLLFTWFVLSSLFSHALFGKWDFREILVNSSLVVLIIGSLYLRREHFSKDFFFTPPMVVVIFIGLCFLINGLVFSVRGYLALALQCLFVFPYYWMGISTNKDQVIFSLSWGFIFSYLIVLCMMFFLGPEFTLFQNSGLFGNPNLMGYYLTTVSSSILYSICRNQERAENAKGFRQKMRILNLFLLGSVVFITFCTTSRTSIICVLGEMILTILFILREKWEDCKKKQKGPSTFFVQVIKDLSLALAVMGFSALMIYLLFIFVKPRFEQMVFGGSSTFYEDYLYDPSAAMEDELDSSLRYYTKGLGDRDLLNFTSGRIEIWKIFIRHLRFLGHKTETLFITFSTRHNRSHGAHNIFIQLAYSIGLPAGIVYFLSILSSDLYYLGRLLFPGKKGKIKAEEMLILMAGSVLALNAMTSSGYLFGRYLVPSHFLLISGPDQKKEGPGWIKRLIEKRRKKEDPS